MILKKATLRKLKLQIKHLALKLTVIFFCATLLKWPEVSISGIKTGISYCVNILVPSLFPFMVITCFVVKSDVFSNFGKLTDKLIKFLFYLPGNTLPVIALSFFGGYPVGAKGVKTLFEHKKINSEQMNRMMCFCVNAGPGFIISVLGGVMFKNAFLGAIIFFSQVISCILIGVFCAIYARIFEKVFYSKSSDNKNLKSNISNLLVESVSNASGSMLEMCALIVTFSCLISIFENINFLNLISYQVNIKDAGPTIFAILTSLLEITAGCAKMANLNLAPEIVAFCVGFGGICAHLQISVIFKNTNFNFKKFYFFRLINAVLSAFVMHIAIKLFPAYSAVFSNSNNYLLISKASSAHGSIVIILLCIYFTVTTNELFSHSKNF